MMNFATVSRRAELIRQIMLAFPIANKPDEAEMAASKRRYDEISGRRYTICDNDLCVAEFSDWNEHFFGRNTWPGVSSADLIDAAYYLTPSALLYYLPSMLVEALLTGECGHPCTIWLGHSGLGLRREDDIEQAVIKIATQEQRRVVANYMIEFSVCFEETDWKVWWDPSKD